MSMLLSESPSTLAFILTVTPAFFASRSAVVCFFSSPWKVKIFSFELFSGRALSIALRIDPVSKRLKPFLVKSTSSNLTSISATPVSSSSRIGPKLTRWSKSTASFRSFGQQWTTAWRCSLSCSQQARLIDSRDCSLLRVRTWPRMEDFPQSIFRFNFAHKLGCSPTSLQRLEGKIEDNYLWPHFADSDLQTRSASFRSEKGRKWKTLQRISGGSFELIFPTNDFVSSAIGSKILAHNSAFDISVKFTVCKKM